MAKVCSTSCYVVRYQWLGAEPRLFEAKLADEMEVLIFVTALLQRYVELHFPINSCHQGEFTVSLDCKFSRVFRNTPVELVNGTWFYKTKGAAAATTHLKATLYRLAPTACDKPLTVI